MNFICFNNFKHSPRFVYQNTLEAGHAVEPDKGPESGRTQERLGEAARPLKLGRAMSSLADLRAYCPPQSLTSTPAFEHPPISYPNPYASIDGQDQYGNTQNFSAMLRELSRTEQYISDAQRAGADVSALRADFETLKPIALKTFVERKIEHLEAYLTSPSRPSDTHHQKAIVFYDARNALDDLSKSGTVFAADLSGLQQKIDGIRPRVFEAIVNELVLDLEGWGQGRELGKPWIRSARYIMGDIQQEMGRAREAGVDLSRIEAQLPALEREALLRDVKDFLAYLERYEQSDYDPYKDSGKALIDRFGKLIDDAEKKGAPVNSFRKEIPRLTKQVTLAYLQKAFGRFRDYVNGQIPVNADADVILRNPERALTEAAQAGNNVRAVEQEYAALKPRANAKYAGYFKKNFWKDLTDERA